MSMLMTKIVHPTFLTQNTTSNFDWPTFILTLMPIVLIGVGTVYFVFFFESKKEKARKVEEVARKEYERTRKIWTAYNLAKQGFENCKTALFDNPINYVESCTHLLNFVKQMQECNSKLTEKKYDTELEIEGFLTFIEKLRDFGEICTEITNKNNMLMSEYGKVDLAYYNYVFSLKKEAVDDNVKQIELCILRKRFGDLVENDPQILLDAIWFYALHKPFSLSDFELAKKTINILCPGLNNSMQCFLAEAYAINQMGGNEALRGKVDDLLRYGNLSVNNLSVLASGLMWMKAYNLESMVLNHMLSNNMEMSAKLQERLHSLSNGGGDAPTGHDVVSKENEIFVDVSSLSWRDKEYEGFFENLIFQEKTLTYSLAIRDADKDLFISKGFSIPDIDYICNKISVLFEEEFGSETKVKKVQFNALSGNDVEGMQGVLATTDTCKHLGIFVHIARIGKKLNIKFYTLYMPEKEQLSNQKQKVMSIYRKINPMVNMWEKTITETILLAMQQILNTGTAATISTNENNTEVEF